jgi:hypothetical protein
MGASVSASVAVIAAMVAQIAVLAEELEAGFDQHSVYNENIAWAHRTEQINRAA